MTTPQPQPMLDREPLLMLMDGHALIHRAWHAIREPLTTRDSGEDTRAIFGFMNIFLKTLDTHKPTHIAAAFDMPTPTFRREMYPQYKEHRPATPEELKSQFQHVEELMNAFGVPVYKVPRFEADDILGSLCRQAEERQIETIVLTGDTDTLQLVSPHVRVSLSRAVGRKTMYDVEAVRERYGGLGPESVAEIKALQGDSSDNIPGIPGIGIKTAIKLLLEFGSIDGIYDKIDDVKPPRAQKSLIANRDLAYLCRDLTTIDRHMDVDLDLDAARFGDFERGTIVEKLRSLDFRRMIDRIPSPNGDGAAQGALAFEDDAPPGEYVIVDTEDALRELVAALDTPEGFSFDTETTSKDPMRARLVGLSFAVEPGRAWYVPVGHAEGKQLPMDDVLAALGAPLANPAVPKTAHNANYDMMALKNHDIDVEGLSFDTMLAAHAAGHSPVGLKNLVQRRFGYEMTPITDLIGRGRKQITMAEVEIGKAAVYAAADADFTERLRRDLQAETRDEPEIGKLLAKVEIPLVRALVAMQRHGVAVDVDALAEISADLQERIDAARVSMFDAVGHEFNLNSPKQLGDVLYDELRLPTPGRNSRSTAAAALDSLKERLDSGELSDTASPNAYEVLDGVLEYRQLSKIKSTYLDPLPGLVNPDTGRVHTKYNQTGSATGRISSSEPNVQNIPVRTELGRQVRRAFVAQRAPASTLLAADYSQIELRVLAHYSQDPSLLEAFHRGEDIHSATSALVYDVPIDEVTPEMRRIAKILNFGVIYGLSRYGIARQTDLSQEQGQAFMDKYFEQYPKIRDYIERTKRQCRELGYVETMLGRRRYLPNINARAFNPRTAAERAAINMPIQGTAADIIKIAMVRIMDRMDAEGMRSKMILQVHDELIFETPRDELGKMSEIVRELMPSSLELRAPLVVELKTGDTWGDLE